MKSIFGILITFTTFFVSCQKGLSVKEKETYQTKGKEIAQATFKRMAREVEKNMKEGGVSQAAPFCNAHADNLTTEMEEKFNVAIKRTSLKLRNEDNAPNDTEKTMLEQFESMLADGKELSPIVELDAAGLPHFYAPIKLKDKCVACHGVIGETMKQKTDSIIKVLYPNDRAIGFKEGDLRGMWSIAFKEQ